ncbi:MAG: hypothetical protein WCW35_13815 [Bacteroidota bacterium]
MKNQNRIRILGLIFFVALSAVFAKEPAMKNKPNSLAKAQLKEWKFFDVNTLNCTINSSGPYCDELRTGSSGLEWPKGTKKTAVFTAGIWVIGVHAPTGNLRTAVQDYQTEYQPGPILSTYNTTTNNNDALGDPSDVRYRLYKINKTDALPGAKTNADYDDWPGDLGAPYIDVDNNGKWDKGVDKPKFWGDQQLWCVYNDGNVANHTPVGRTSPMGLEIQTTYFGFDQPGAIGNIMFMRWKIINKSDADYDSVFISMWSDTDMGDANDDMTAVDTVRKLSYTYNGDNDDGTAAGYGSKPPSVGFVFFQGPIVAGAATDTALFEGEKIGGARNLKAYSHAFYTNGGAWSDPSLGSVLFAEQAYNYQNGLVGATGQPFINPQTNQASRFVFPGDPVTGSGWTQDKSGLNPDDVRAMISSGPFTLAQGDTQEIVGGLVIAQGADRLKSVELLRLYTDVAQEAFDVNFVLPSPPPQPRVVVGELPNKVILNWGDTLSYDKTETYSFIGAAKKYKFQGYNVYQLEGPSSTFPSKLLATYDIVDSVMVVFDEVTDPVSGQKVQLPSALGGDYGIQRHFVIDKDFIGGQKLINGKQYYFAVTSYAYNTDPQGVEFGFPQILENSKSVMTIIPRGVKAGDSYGGTIGQALLTNRAINGDDAVSTEIINPKELTGSRYTMVFHGTDTLVTSWSLKRHGSGGAPDTFLVNNNTNFNGTPSSPIVDGIQWKVRKASFGPRRDTQTPRGVTYSPAANAWFSGKTTVETMDAFGGGVAYPTANNFLAVASGYKAFELKKIEIRFSNTTTQKAYRYLDFVISGFVPLQPRHSSFLPFMKHRAPGGQYIYQDYVDVPFTAWEVDSLDGSPAPRQLNVGFLERNDSMAAFVPENRNFGKIDGQWGPTNATTGGHEILFIFGSTYSADTLTRYTRVPTDTTNNTKFLNLKGSMSVIDVMYAVWVRAADSTKTFTNGDKLTIVPNYPIVATNTFSLTAPKNVENNNTLISSNISKINVFPNPYFANNKAESNIYQRFVTFSNLPNKATIRIFSLMGDLIKTLNHDNTTGYERWDLRNIAGLPVASGMYIAYIEIPGVGNKTLKLAIIQPEERPSRL